MSWRETAVVSDADDDEYQDTANPIKEATQGPGAHFAPPPEISDPTIDEEEEPRIHMPAPSARRDSWDGLLKVDDSELPAHLQWSSPPPLPLPGEEKFALHPTPRWIPDNGFDCCMRCHTKFSLMIRRHHCRACGHLLCKKCLPEKLALPQMEITEPELVCGRCHRFMMDSTYRLIDTRSAIRVGPEGYKLIDVAKTLARSFWDDPVMSWVFQDPAHRLKALEWFFTVFVQLHHEPDNPRCDTVHLMYDPDVRRAESVSNVENISDLAYGHRYVTAAAIWNSNGDAPSVLSTIAAGYWRAPLLWGVAAAKRSLQLEGITKLHKERMHGVKHWYLFAIGTLPEMQGKGYGSQIIKRGLDQADAEDLACWLESSKEANIPFYKKHGFRVVQKIEGYATGAPPLWAMHRPRKSIRG